MKISIHKACYILWIMLAVFYVFIFGYFTLDIKGGQPKNHYQSITDYTVEIMQDSSAPAGQRSLYTFTLSGIKESYCELVFYCIHQTTNVYLEDECIYSMKPQDSEVLIHSPGYVWNSLSFSEEDNGKEVTIEITPVYGSSKNVVPLMYFGNKYDIARSIIFDALPNLFFSIVVIVVGSFYIFFVQYNNRKTVIEKDLSMLGFFSIQLGLWKISESEAINFLFSGHPALSQVTFISLMFMTLSIVLYVKNLYSTSDRLIWKIPYTLGFANIILTVLLQYSGTLDMRLMLPVTHILIGIITLVTIIMTIYEIRFVGINAKLKLHLWCLTFAFAGGGMDMLLYYVTDGSAPAVFTMVGFLIYILVLGMSSMQEIKKLISFGVKAQHYEDLAYHDQLTGLYNRMAYEEHKNGDDFDPENCIILIMDLNNLKQCNDVYGHPKGDIYIKTAAELILECFEDIGRCYRMGGDEFCVIITDSTLALCKQRVAKLQKQIASCTAVKEDFKMGIACGFKAFDRSLDRDISETARRADKAMYQNKFSMKE